MALTLNAQAVLPAAGGLIQSIEPDSLLDELPVQPGDLLLAINGHPLRDIIDYRFYSAAEHTLIELEREGKRFTVAVEKDSDEPLGAEFGVALFDDIIRCNNNCYFCFVGGNSRGMRRSLFIKDDDFRLSFLFGNFATLTNLSPADWARIEEQRLSPLYVSVHATELKLRRKLLANSHADDILAQLDWLAERHIQAHCQLVICPGLNDGEHLDRSVRELAGRYPWVQSIAVVPVGLTDANQVRGAHKLKAADGLGHQILTEDYARSILAQLRPYQQQFQRRYHTPLVYPSDEYYLAADEPAPPAAHYGAYAQYENGVGMVRSLLEDWRRLKAKLARAQSRLRPRAEHMTLVSGTLIEPVLAPMIEELAAATGASCDYVAAANRRYGASINCSGLLAGQDILAALEGKPLGDVVVLPRYALDDDDQYFIDDLTPAEMEQRLGRPVIYVEYLSQLVTRRNA